MSLIVTDRQYVDHSLTDELLRARVRGWMNLEAGGHDFWIGTHTTEGRWIHCASRRDTYAPSSEKRAFAMRVCLHINKQLTMGGAWLCGWLLDGSRFYLLWKDPDGDIQIPIECDKSFAHISEWELDAWSRLCFEALTAWAEIHAGPELARGQGKLVAQGEQVSPTHLDKAPQVKL